MLDNKDSLLKCECGSVFFNEVRAKTYLSNRFIFYGDGPRSQLEHEDVIVPIAICVFCGKTHIPGTSFSGMSSLNRSVQCYAELLEQQRIHIEAHNVKTEPNSEVNPAHVVRPSTGRGKSSKANKE